MVVPISAQGKQHLLLLLLVVVVVVVVVVAYIESDLSTYVGQKQCSVLSKAGISHQYLELAI